MLIYIYNLKIYFYLFNHYQLSIYLTKFNEMFKKIRRHNAYF